MGLDSAENSAERPQTCCLIALITGLPACPYAMSYFKDILLGKMWLNASLFHFIIICLRCWRGRMTGTEIALALWKSLWSCPGNVVELNIETLNIKRCKMLLMCKFNFTKWQFTVALSFFSFSKKKRKSCLLFCPSSQDYDRFVLYWKGSTSTLVDLNDRLWRIKKR